MRADREARGDLVFGMDVGGSKIALGAVTGAGEVVTSRRHPTGADRGPEAIIRDLVRHIRDLQDEIQAAPSGIGVGICGQVSVGSQVVRRSPNLPGWKDVPLRDRLEEALGVPVVMANDVQVIALGEWALVEEHGVHDLVVVFVGTGVGGGVVSGGRLLRGHLGHAAELGHATIVVDGRECRCGNTGCLEAYAGGWAIAERAREAAGADPEASARLVETAGGLERIRSETVAEAFAAGDGFARRIVEETGHYLGAGLVGVVNGFNPRRLVLGGGVLGGIPQLFEMARKHIGAHALEAATRELEIAPVGLGPDAGILGAAVLARQGKGAGTESQPPS